MSHSNQEFSDGCFDIDGEEQFNEYALTVFRQQAKHVKVYADYIRMLNLDPLSVNSWEEIPYLPISFFKTEKIIHNAYAENIVFSSSGTTGSNISRHYVSSVELYIRSFTEGFVRAYGHPSEFVIIALLPSYLERQGSSLVYMAEYLIRESGHPDSGFYLDQFEQLSIVLHRLKEESRPVMLLGVTFALLDFSAAFPMYFPELIVMETGGMKGRRKEMVREEVHQQLQRNLGVRNIHSEYGMTELLSQAYSAKDGLFKSPPWMRVRMREINDPFSYCMPGVAGGICVTDLANAYSCSFIATEDIGKLHADGCFEVLGRFDQAETRGCNLMVF